MKRFARASSMIRAVGTPARRSRCHLDSMARSAAYFWLNAARSDSLRGGNCLVISSNGPAVLKIASTGTRMRAKSGLTLSSSVIALRTTGRQERTPYRTIRIRSEQLAQFSFRKRDAMIALLRYAIRFEGAVIELGGWLDRWRQQRRINERHVVVCGRQRGIVRRVEIDEAAETIRMVTAQHAQYPACARVSNQNRLL